MLKLVIILFSIHLAENKNVGDVITWNGDIRIFLRACYEWLNLFNELSCLATKDHPYIVQCQRVEDHPYFSRCGFPSMNTTDLASNIEALEEPNRDIDLENKPEKSRSIRKRHPRNKNRKW